MANENLQWSISLDLAGVPLLGFFVPLPTGPYKVKITRTVEVDNEGKKTVRVSHVVLDDGPCKNLPVDLNLGKDLTKKGNVYSWKRLMASVGASGDVLERNGLVVGPDTLKDRTAYIHVTEKQEGEEYDQRQYITQAIYEQLKANPQLAAAAAAPRTASAAAQPGAQVASPGAAVTSPPPASLGQLQL
jgi:hypothetical protein